MEATLKAENRTETGRRGCRALRSAGRVPAILYGKGGDVEQLSLDGATVREYFAKVASQELTLELGGKTTAVKIGEIQRHPISRDVLHIDFIRN